MEGLSRILKKAVHSTVTVFDTLEMAVPLHRVLSLWLPWLGDPLLLFVRRRLIPPNARDRLSVPRERPSNYSLELFL